MPPSSPRSVLHAALQSPEDPHPRRGASKDRASAPRHINVLRVLDPQGLEAVLRKFSKSFGVKGVVSIDGKALRGAFTRGRQAAPLHMVNVWAAGTRMALAQRKAPNRNEVAGALEVLALLDLEGAVVTAYALHCRPDTAQAIRDRKGHYVFAIKSNRGRLFKAVKALARHRPKASASEPAKNLCSRPPRAPASHRCAGTTIGKAIQGITAPRQRRSAAQQPRKPAILRLSDSRRGSSVLR